MMRVVILENATEITLLYELWIEWERPEWIVHHFYSITPELMRMDWDNVGFFISDYVLDFGVTSHSFIREVASAHPDLDIYIASGFKDTYDDMKELAGEFDNVVVIDKEGVKSVIRKYP